MTHVPTDAKLRKAIPVYTGFIRYFPDAILAVAELSRIGNDQHNPGKPLAWDRSKSTDELDALSRHLLDAEEVDADHVLHATKIAWRAMANLQKLIEKRQKTDLPLTAEWPIPVCTTEMHPAHWERDAYRDYQSTLDTSNMKRFER